MEGKLERYLALTREALEVAGKNASKENKERAKEFLGMAQDYYNDALFFKSKGDHATALAAASYAHAWLDAGARMGFFDVKGNNRLFVVD